MAIPDGWVEAAVAITPGFEVQGDPYLGVSGDFDRMGISCGALQWNIGQNSLQPMVKGAGKPAVLGAMPNSGSAMWEACNASISRGLTIVRGWQNNTVLKPKAKAELRALMATPEMRAQQAARIDRVAQTALDQATRWNRNAQPSKRMFCWFFDLVTQNGGLDGLSRTEVTEFIAATGTQRTDDLICDFLRGQRGNSGHIRDAHKNADAWRNKANGDKLEILAMSYLRSKTASSTWRHVVLNRKGTIAMGGGWVNSGRWDFARHGL